MTLILVSGLGRCGTTAMMKAIHAAGYQTIGREPDFEDARALSILRSTTDNIGFSRAVKWLDPQRPNNALPVFHYCRAIFLTRDHDEQAKSMLRFMGTPENRHALRGVKKTLDRDLPIAQAIVRKAANGLMYPFCFEDMIRHPYAVMLRVASILYPDAEEETKKKRARIMASAIHARGCAALPRSMEWA